MRSDHDLLLEYAQKRTESAFAEIVRRYADLVYSAALRQLTSPQQAQDVSQGVFIDLARKADRLCGPEEESAGLAGWLYTATRFACLDLLKREQRRAEREMEAMEMLSENSAGPDWSRIAPVLDEAMEQLEPRDREAILLRFFQKSDFRTVGTLLGLSDDAAQKRVSRALERLRGMLSARGVGVSSGALAAVLTTQAVQAAPLGLAAGISSIIAMAGGGAIGTGIVTAAKGIAMTTAQKAIMAVALSAAIGTAIYQANQSRVLKREVAALRTQNAAHQARAAELIRERDEALRKFRGSGSPQLPAPPVKTFAAGSTETDPAGLIQRTLAGDNSYKLNAGQIAGYLEENGRGAASLLAGYRTSGDRALLEEAKKNFPNDPQVAFEAMHAAGVSSEERRQWIEALKKSNPENAFANYLSALDYFKAGEADLAVQELVAATRKNSFDDFTLSRLQDDEEIYRAAGHTVAESKTIPAAQLLLPQLSSLKELSGQIVELSKAYQSNGDAASAQAALEIAARLGQRYTEGSPGQPTISQLVGQAIERIALGAMDPNESYGEGEMTVQQRLAALQEKNDRLREIARRTDGLLNKMTEQDWITYKDRWKNSGEEAAAQWLIRKYSGEKN